MRADEAGTPLLRDSRLVLLPRSTSVFDASPASDGRIASSLRNTSRSTPLLWPGCRRGRDGYPQDVSPAGDNRERGERAERSSPIWRYYLNRGLPRYCATLGATVALPGITSSDADFWPTRPRFRRQAISENLREELNVPPWVWVGDPLTLTARRRPGIGAHGGGESFDTAIQQRYDRSRC